jgi:RNA polymerase sigma-70 factor (ECF subfamily)
MNDLVPAGVLCSVEAVTAHPFALQRDDPHDRALEAEALSRRRRFENLLERHEGRLRRLAFGMIGDPHRVDDVLQDAFVKVYRSLPARFESDAHEAAWLYRVVHRTCLNELRARGRRRETGFPEDVVADGATSEESIAVAAALADLPVDARAVILLVDLIGLDYETAAAALHVPRGTVASRLNTARGLLRAALGGSDA